MTPHSSSPEPADQPSRTKEGLLDRAIQKIGQVFANQTVFMLALLLIMMFTFSRFSPYFLTKDNLLQVTIQAAVICMLGAGQTFVILTAGIDLGVGSVLALVTVVSAIAMEASGGLVPGLIAGLAVGAACGFMNGFIVGKMKVPAFVATLGMMGVARGLALIVTSGIPKYNLAPGSEFLGQGRIGGIPVPTISVFATFAACYIILTRTKLGRYTYAIGSNPHATLLSGINTSRHLIWVYTISGITAGLAGLTELSRLGSGQPAGGAGYELDAIASVVLGGTSLLGGEGHILGTLIGGLIIASLRNGLNLLNIYAFWQQVAIGVILILAVFADQLRRGARR